MISKEALNALARKHQTSEFPNIVREYFQHLFLSELYKLPGAEKMLFKGGTALRVIYQSPRFSEDLDFSLFKVESRLCKEFIEGLFINVLSNINNAGIQVDLKEASPTSGGYFGLATFYANEYQPVSVEINISARNGKKISAEPDSVASDFVPTYTVLHLPQSELVEEKIFGALLNRQQPRDFYDAYFIMRKGMLNVEQKKRLAAVKEKIITSAKNINFKTELEALLPADQHQIIKDFSDTLKREFERQLANI